MSIEQTAAANAATQSRCPADGVVPGGYARVSTILALAPLLGQFDVHLGDVLAVSGLPADQFDNPDHLIPFREGSRMLGLCADHTGCAHLGLLIGKHTPLESLGIVAELVLSAPDVRSGLRLMVRYFTLTDGGGLLTLSESEHHAEFGYALYEPGVVRAELLYDIGLAIAWNVLRKLCGARWTPDEVVFSRRTPIEPGPYRTFFKAPLRFDADRSVLVFNREWLDAPLATRDPVRLRSLEEQVREREMLTAGGLPAQVRRILRRQLLHGTHSMQLVADELALHRRTLDRRLQDDQVTFRALVDEVRFEVSRQLLETNMPVADIAQSLQYANPAAFTRAFRRWAGVTPQAWRSTHRSKPVATEADTQ